MVLNDTYRKYFLHQAIHHPDLAHQPDRDRVFEIIDVEEALGDLRTSAKEKDFIMRLLMYTYELNDNYTEDINKYMHGGFIIAKHHSHRKDGKNGFYEAMRLSEKVVDEIIDKMIGDSRNGHPLFYYSLNTAQNIQVAPLRHAGDIGFSGWLCTFRIASWFPHCLAKGITDAEHVPAWTDGGITPYEL